MNKIRPAKQIYLDLKYWNRSMTLNTEAEQTRIVVKKNMYINQKGSKKILSLQRGKVYNAIKVFIVQRVGNYKWKYVFIDERGYACVSSHLSVFLENRTEIRNSIIDNLLESS